MNIRNFRIAGVALTLTALFCAAPLPRAEAAAAAPRIYLYDNIFGITDVTATFDGSSVVSITGEVVFVNFAPLDPDNKQHTDELTSDPNSKQHTDEIVLDDANNVVGFVAP